MEFAEVVAPRRTPAVANDYRAGVEKVKTVALACGLRIRGSVLVELGGPEALTIHEYATTGGVTLALPEGVLVNAPFDEPFCSASPLVLERSADGLVLTLGETVVPVVGVLPLPGFLNDSDESGRLVRDAVMSHADRIRVSPIVGCAFDCRFCDLGTLRYERRPLDQLLAAIDVALADGALPTRHLLISGGSPAALPEHQDYFEDTCLAIVQHVRDRRSDFQVDIMMSPARDGAEFVERLVGAGIDGLSLNVELFSADAAAMHLPLKHKRNREHLESAIQRAVELTGGAGRVRSLIIPGLESVEQTLAGIEWLASLGCDPVISPFRPARHTPLASALPVSAEDLSAVLTRAREIVAAHGVALGPRCVPCQHNTLSFPWDVPAG